MNVKTMTAFAVACILAGAASAQENRLLYSESFSNGQIPENTYRIEVVRFAMDMMMPYAMVCDDRTLEGGQSQDGDNGYLAIYDPVKDDEVRITCEKPVDLRDAACPEMTFYVYNPAQLETGLSSENVVGVWIYPGLLPGETGKGWERVLYKTVRILSKDVKNQWIKVKVDLKQYKGRKVKFAISGRCGSQRYTLFDNIRIEDNLAGVGETQEDGITVRTGKGTIGIAGAGNWSVCGTDGIVRGSGNGDACVSVPAGIYIVRTEGATRKVLVRD